MNMKKTIAGAIAGIVAVSAMATTAFAAEESKTFSTYKTTTSYSGTASFTGIIEDKTNNVTVTLPAIFGDDAAVTALEIAGQKIEGDAIKLYASISSDVVTINPILGENGKIVSVTVTDSNASDVYTGTSITTSTNAGANTISSVTAKEVKTKNYLAVPKTLTSIDADGFTGLTATIANYIGDAKNVKLVVNFKDMEPASTTEEGETAPDYSQDLGFSSTTTTSDFGIMINNSAKLSTAVSLDKTAMTATFDWDKLLADAKVNSATGVVSSIQIKAANALVATFGSDDAAKYVITGFTVVKNAESVSVETDKPADTTKPSTDDKTNPSTGVAPVALAIIPVALAAAVVVAKRK